jgi:hypothetical protein
MKLLPALMLCLALALLSGSALFMTGLARVPAWLSALFLISTAGVLAVGVRIVVGHIRRQTDAALNDAMGARAAPSHRPRDDRRDR